MLVFITSLVLSNPILNLKIALLVFSKHSSDAFDSAVIRSIVVKNKDIISEAEVHLVAGLVPKEVPIDDLAQALRSIGEPIFGQAVKDLLLRNLRYKKP